MEKESLEARMAKLEEEVRKLKGAIEPAKAIKIIPEAAPAPGEKPVPAREETIRPAEEPYPSREKVAPPETKAKAIEEESPKERVKLRTIEKSTRDEPELVSRPARPSWEIPGQVREKWLRLEAIIGERWLVWIGALVFAGGFGVFLKYAFEQGWLNEIARFILGLLGGFILIGFGEFLHRKKFQALAQGLSGLGLIILYLTVFMAYRFYQVCGSGMSFVLFFAITIGGMSIAMFHNAFPTAFLSVFGALATPIMLIDPTKTVYYEPMLFSYLLVINLGILYVSSVKKWKALSLFSFLCTVIYFGRWYLSEYILSDFALAAGFVAGYFILFSLVSTLYSIIWKKRSSREDLLLVILNPAVFFLIGYDMLTDRGSVAISPYVPLAMAIYHFILAGVIRRVNAKDLILYGGLMGTAIGLLTLPVPMTVKSYWITVTWGAEAVILIIAGSMIGRKALRIGGLAVFLLVIFRLLFLDSFLPYHGTDHHLLFLNLKFLALFLSSIAFGLAALSFSRFQNLTSAERTYAGPLWSVFGVSLFWVTNLELFSYFANLTGLAGRMKWAYSTVLWSAFFLWLLLHGTIKRIKTLRMVGLGLIGATAAKVFLLDTPMLYSYYRYGYPFLFNVKFLSQIIFTGSIFAAAFLYGRRLKEGEEFEENALWFLWSAFTVMLFLCLNFEVFSYFGHIKEVEIRMMRLIFTTMLWTGFSCWFLLSGILRDRYKLRLTGFFFIGATAFKLFLVDVPLMYDYSYGYPFLLNLKFLSLALLLTTVATGALLYVKKGIRLENWERAAVPLLWGVFVSLLFLGLNVEVVSYFGRSQILSVRLESFIFTTILWSIFSFLLIFVGIRNEITPLRIAGLALVTITFVKIIVEDSSVLYPYPYGYPFLFNLKFLSAALLLFTLAFAASLYTEKEVTGIRPEKKAVPYLWCLFLILLFVELHSQATLSFYRIWNLGEQRAAFALSLLWVLYGFGLLLAGMIKKILPLRISALSLFGVTLLKVLFVDLRFTGKLYKIYVLFGIGSILLIAAYFYRRYRKTLREKV